MAAFEKQPTSIDDDKSDIRFEEDIDQEIHENLSLIQPQPLAAEQQALRNYGNAGPKAVLMDYAEAKQRARERIERENEEKWRYIQEKSMTIGLNKEQNKDQIKEEEEEEKKEVENISDDEFEDDEELEKFYEQRRKELEKSKKVIEQPKTTTISTFGLVYAVTVHNYNQEISNVSARTFVIVHLYADYVPACVELNKYLNKLAMKFPKVKFLRANKVFVKPNYDDFALPSLVIYQNTQVISSHLRVGRPQCSPSCEFIGEEFDEQDIEILLAKDGVVPMPRMLKF
eukprot:TRINITY_DN0_c2_g1_i1.p1 TRINITY_DN0_c2_g1~~TRINITY_DN0_c2_g1_i1.p1  ORF type:complete len:286 (+),score=115.73 TRINITY_DN0_c2_g1_i1:48-905(+)